jgi:site-specific recombinase XerD
LSAQRRPGNGPRSSSAISKFAEHLVLERRRSRRTVKEYISDLQLLAQYAYEKSEVNEALLKISSSNIRRFVMHMTDRGLSASIVRRRIAAFRTFYNFARAEGLRGDNPVTGVLNIKLPGRLPKSLSIKDTERLLLTRAPAGNTEFQQRRDAAILELLYATGIRRAELVGINLTDLDLERQTIRVVGKGNKERIVYFHGAAADALKRYLLKRPPALDGALFVSKRNQRLSYPQVGNIFRLYARLSGLEGKITPHTLRHSFATHLLQRGVDISTVMKLLGHESIVTTQIYTKVTDEHARQSYIEAHPRSRTGRDR